MIDHRKNVKKELRILESFELNLKENLAKIEIAEREVRINRELIEEFKNDDMFINSLDNYSKLYQELAAQRNKIITEFDPKIEKIMFNKEQFVKNIDFDNLSESLEVLKEEVRLNEKNISEHCE